jgi:hypothetical protein
MTTGEYSEDNYYSSTEEEYDREYILNAETIDEEMFLTPHGDLSISDEDSNVAHNGSGEENNLIENDKEPNDETREYLDISSSSEHEGNRRSHNGINRITMLSDDDIFEYSDGELHLPTRWHEGDQREVIEIIDVDSNIEEYDEESSQSSEHEIPESINEYLDAITFENDYTKSKIVTARCAYTLEDNQRCIRCYKCHETYSFEGIMENHSYHNKGERVCCPTCKTPIETVLLIQLSDKETVKGLIEQRWNERLSSPEYSLYMETLKMLSDSGVLKPSEKILPLIKFVSTLISLRDDHERPIPIECPVKLQRLTIELFMYSNYILKMREDVISKDMTIYNKINRISSCPDTYPFSDGVIQRLLYKPKNIAIKTICFVLRMSKVIKYNIRIEPCEFKLFSDLIMDVSEELNQWRYKLKTQINHPCEVIGMIYQQLSETGYLTKDFVERYSTNIYCLFRRYNVPIQRAIDVIIEALLPLATPVHRKIVNEIINCGDRRNPFIGFPIQFFKSLSAGESTCKCGGPILDHTCILCGQRYCAQCEDSLTPNHVCNHDKLLSLDAIRSTTVQCPKCHIHIEKSHGCDHMYCTQCKCNFDWTSGKIIKESEQTNDIYLSDLSETESEYSYYINTLIADYEEYAVKDINIYKSRLCYILSTARLGIFDENQRSKSVALLQPLNTIIQHKIAKESIAALRPAVANMIKNTIDILSESINDYTADIIATRITQKSIIALRNIL